jgi:dUTP pyrophosphatase
MQYVKLNEKAKDLGYARPGDAGIDLSVIEFIALAPFGDDKSKKLLKTGISVKIPEGHFGLIVPRSSMAKKGIMLANTCGIIDSGYTGELMLYVQNMTAKVNYIEEGDRVAQMIVVPFTSVILTSVDKLPETDRGTGGFGSTGV